jgi:hypothetical protein
MEVNSMADYCKQCAEDHGFPNPGSDFAGLVEEDYVAQVLCEGCGFAVVDHTGASINWKPPTSVSIDEFLTRKKEG